jgi:hypothetical protein
MYLYSSSIQLTCFRHLSRITPPAGLHHGWWRRQIQAQECGLALSFLLRFGLGPAMRKSCVGLHSRHARVVHAHAISHRICWLASNNSTSQQCTWAQQRLAPAGFGQTTASTTVRQAGEFCSPRGTQPLQARMEGGTEVGRTLFLWIQSVILPREGTLKITRRYRDTVFRLSRECSTSVQFSSYRVSFSSFIHA